MSLDTLLTIALDTAFFAVFGFTLVDYLRNRGRVRLVVVLVFASLAVVLGVPLLRTVAPGIGSAVGIIVLPALLAQPALVLWLASFVWPIPRAALIAALVAFLGLMAAFGVVMASGPTSGTPGLTLLVVALLAYFLVLEGAAAMAFALAARARAGASRSRLATAAVATALFAVALAMALGANLAAEPGSTASAAAAIGVRVLATLSALGYLVAFAPPRALRRLSQQSLLYEFIRELSALPQGTPIDRIWALLERTATRASGAALAKVVIDDPAPAVDPSTVVHASPGSAPIAIRFTSLRWPEGRLDLDLDTRALFRDDDLELIGMLLERAVRAAERESLVTERERLIADLQAASAAKSNFLAAMSHELRTPLNAIIGFSDLLRQGGDDASDAATVQNFSEHIHASGLHLLELVNDVLDLARVEAGRLDLKPTSFELDALVRQTAATMHALAERKHLTVDLRLAPIEIEADASRMRQVVLNLLSNAVKFTEPGGEIRLDLERDGSEHVRLTVADTGRGIAQEDLEVIFEAFQQGTSGPATAHHEGTGLGLALTRELVEAHGGEVSVRSEVGVGSVFAVRLPIGADERNSTSRPAAHVAPAAPAAAIVGRRRLAEPTPPVARSGSTEVPA